MPIILCTGCSTTIDLIKPIFREYLGVMSHFFDIRHYDRWCEGAVRNLQRYAFGDDRHIYILKNGESIIGFAFINQHRRFNKNGAALAEFYIRDVHTKKGHGRRLAEHVFEQFPGRWEVAVALKNKAGLRFWEQVISAYTGGRFARVTKNSFSGYGFSFNTLQ